jgi:eukaryotic-like serine/threonine-protein kinase
MVRRAERAPTAGQTICLADLYATFGQTPERGRSRQADHARSARRYYSRNSDRAATWFPARLKNRYKLACLDVFCDGSYYENMETLTAATTWTQLEGIEIDARYLLGTCLAEGERQAVYETTYREEPAVIKLIQPGTSQPASELLAALNAGKELQHPNLIAIRDFGQTSVEGNPIVYAVMERADENLAGVLRIRTLNEDEARELLASIVPALEFLHANGFVHSRLRPSNVLACGDSVKLSSDRLRSLSSPVTFVGPPSLHDAPETAAGRFGPACDVWSLAVLTLETLTGSPLESSLGQLGWPFRQIVEKGMTRNPAERWSPAQIADALETPAPDPPVLLKTQDEAIPRPRLVYDRPDAEPPRYRKLGVFAVGGALLAGGICALLIRSAHQKPAPGPVVEVAARQLPASVAQSPPRVQLQDPVQIPESKPTLSAATGLQTLTPGWAVVGAAYRRVADAEKRAAEIRERHPALDARVYAPDGNGRRYMVLFATGLTETQAKRQLDQVRRDGGPRDSYISRFR